MVKDIRHGLSGSNPNYYTVLNNTLYFTANDSTHELELWRSNGTVAGTYLVKDTYPGLFNFYPPKDLVTSAGKLYFSAYDGADGYEPWVSDGTDTGTFMLKDICVGCDSEPKQYLEMNGVTYFVAAELSSGYCIWKTDGTNAGTEKVRAFGMYSPNFFGVINNTMVFTVRDSAHGVELWKTDGTDAGTALVKDIFPGVASSNISGGGISSGLIYFGAKDGIHGRELWKSDGTTAGTIMVKDILPGPGEGLYTLFSPIDVNGKIYFRTDDSVHGMELWQSDGTDGGTFMIQDLNPGLAYSDPRYLTVMGNYLYFRAEVDGVGRELFRLDMNYPTGITNPEPRNNKVTIQPVPASDKIVIRNNDPALNSKPASIIDMQGRKIYQFLLSAIQTIDISEWTAGLYILQLPDGTAMKIVKA